MLFFKTNMDRTEQCDCGIIYNLHIQLKHWQGGSAGKGRIKKTQQKASRSRSIRCPNNKPDTVSLKEGDYSKCLGRQVKQQYKSLEE